jgi:hypothetical protein
MHLSEDNIFADFAGLRQREPDLVSPSMESRKWEWISDVKAGVLIDQVKPTILKGTAVQFDRSISLRHQVLETENCPS